MGFCRAIRRRAGYYGTNIIFAGILIMSIFIRNHVTDLEPLGESVMGGFQQVKAGLLPSPLVADLSVLRKTLAEGMTIEFEKLCYSDDKPQERADRDLFMGFQRKYEDNIPGYSEITGDLIFDDEY